MASDVDGEHDLFCQMSPQEKEAGSMVRELATIDLVLATFQQFFFFKLFMQCAGPFGRHCALLRGGIWPVGVLWLVAVDFQAVLNS